MKTSLNKSYLKTLHYIFKIILGFFFGLTALSIIFYVIDIFTPGNYFFGYYNLLYRVGLNFETFWGERFYIGHFLFNSEFLASTFTFLYYFIYLASLLVIVFQMSSIFNKAYHEQLFLESSIISLKRIGLLIIFIPMILLIIQVMAVFFLIPGYRLKNHIVSYWGLDVLIVKIFFSWFYYGILGMFFFYIGEVIDKGYKLKIENDLTV